MDKKVRMGDQPWITCLVDSYFFVSFVSLSLFLMRRWHTIFGIILYCRCTDGNSRPVSRFFAYVDSKKDPRNEVRPFKSILFNHFTVLKHFTNSVFWWIKDKFLFFGYQFLGMCLHLSPFQLIQFVFYKLPIPIIVSFLASVFFIY